MAETVAYVRTPQGQLIYDLAFVDLTDKHLARKHHIPVAEIRNLRKIPSVVKLRRQTRKMKGRA